jgi:ligand-binding sensor domain-containing protein/two-component sensor histidine kinase
MFRQATRLALLALFAQIALFSLDPSLRVSQYRKEYWEVEQGLPHSYVTAIAKDDAGYLLIGTDEGLARFDGLDFRPLPSDPSLRLATSWISAILASGDSSLWLGTFDGVLMELRNSKVQAKYQTGSSIFDLRQDSSNALWVSTRNGVLRLANGTLQRVSELGPPLDTSWNVLSRDTHGRLWIVTASGLFSESAGAISLRLQKGAPGEILTVLARRTGDILVGTTRGLLRLSLERAELPVPVPGIAGPVVTLLEDRDGIVWVGTWGQGLFRLTNRGVDRWSTRDGLPEDFIRTMAEDAEGNLWIGMRSAGLGQWRDSRLIPLGPPEGLAGSFATTVAADRSGNLWLGTWRGGLYRLRNSVIESQPTPLPTLYFTVRALAFDPAGNPWVGNWEGLFRFDGKRYEHFASQPNAPYRRVSALLFDRKGGLWVGTVDHGIFLFPNGQPAAPIPSPLVPDCEITALLEDSDGNIWVGTSKGLGKFGSEGPVRLVTFKNLPAGAVKSIFEDSRKRIWASTLEGMIFVVSPGGAAVLDRGNGLPGQPLYRILEAADGSLWVSSSKGILEMPREALEQVLRGQRQRLEIILHDQNDGMRTIECHGLSQPAGWRATDGSLWFPTAQGFVQVRPAALRRLPPPKPVIEDVRTEEGLIAAAPEMILKAGARNVQIAFTALRFSNSRGVQFRYRVMDYDSSWIDAGGQRGARYNQLPPGAHVFEVQARDPAGDWSESASLVLRQQPRFLETGWFVMILALAISSLVIAVYRWRLHVVHSRYALVLDERNRIGREWHDTLVAGFSAISLQLEAAMARLKERPDRAAEILDVTRKMVHHYRAEARRVIWDLRDSRPEGETLSGAVESAHSRMQATRGVGGKVTIIGQPMELPAEMQHNILRICQEAMSNAVRHGHPSQVDIELAYTANRIIAVVRDDGCGFSVEDPSADAGHFGLAVMEERARRIGGRLTIASRPGEGTVVEADIPIER